MNNLQKVLSIQSHVCFGYAGNKAAVFPLQKIGIDVSPIYTVQLSNHTHYKKYTGDFFSAEHIKNVIEGLKENNFLEQYDGMLSGYIGTKEIACVIADTLNQIKKINPLALYCCDPVFGDFNDKNMGHIFASDEHPKFFLKYLLPLADIITPNLFELSILSDTDISNLEDIKKACQKLVKLTNKENQIIIVTSASVNEGKTGIAVFKNGEMFFKETNKYSVKPTVSGSGDITAALFLGYTLKGYSVIDSLEKISNTLEKIFHKTHDLDSPELALIQSQEYI